MGKSAAHALSLVRSRNPPDQPITNNMQIPSIVRIATLRDRSYVTSLAKKFSAEVGFLPHEAIRKRIEQAAVRIVEENGAPAGFMVTANQLSDARHIRPIFQAAVQMDAQRRHLGLRLLATLAADAYAGRQQFLQCWCREGLEANEFWQAAGFVKIATRCTQATRKLPSILWRKPLLITTPEQISTIDAQTSNRGSCGRSLSRFDWDNRPLIMPQHPADVVSELERLHLLA